MAGALGVGGTDQDIAEHLLRTFLFSDRASDTHILDPTALALSPGVAGGYDQ